MQIRRVAPLAALLVLGFASSARAQLAPFTSFEGYCPPSQIGQSCVAPGGSTGTCVPAECSISTQDDAGGYAGRVDSFCAECGECVGFGQGYRYCSPTDPCNPGVPCVAGSIGGFGNGPSDNPDLYSLLWLNGTCEPGFFDAGPVPGVTLITSTTPAWVPCGGANQPPWTGPAPSSHPTQPGPVIDASVDPGTPADVLDASVTAILREASSDLAVADADVKPPVVVLSQSCSLQPGRTSGHWLPALAIAGIAVLARRRRHRA